MSDSAFLQAIRAFPEDDLPRLVYADWLEEHGNPIRAEFIRVQCELASTPEHEPRYRILEDREHELLSKYEPQFLGSSWPKNWQIGPSEWSWKRGFLDEVSINFGNLMNAGYLCEHPVRSLNISSDFGQPTELLERDELRPMLEGLNGIDFSGWSNPDAAEVRRFLQSDELAQLCEVNFDQLFSHFETMSILRYCPEFCRRMTSLQTGGIWPGGDFSDETAVLDLLEHGPLKRLVQTDLNDSDKQLLGRLLGLNAPSQVESLSLDDNPRIACLSDLKQYRHPAKIRELELSSPAQSIWNNQLPFINDEPFAQLLVLSLSGVPFSLDEAYQLSESKCWKQSIQRFSFKNHNPSAVVLQSLFQRCCSKTLKDLNFSACNFSNSALEAIFKNGLSSQLTQLHLVNSGLTDDSLRILRDVNDFGQLRTFLLSRNRFSSTDLNRFCHQVSLPKLRLLSLAGNPADDRTVAELLIISQLSGLGLSNTAVSSYLVESLANTASLKRLNWLDLGTNPNLSESALLALAESPYLSRLCEVDLSGCGISDRVRDAFQARLGPRFSG